MLRLNIVILFFALSVGSFAQDQLSQNTLERLYQRGRDLVNHANYGAAREVFTDFLAQASASDARRSEAEYYVAFSALNLQHRDGEKLIDQFITNNPSSPKAATAYYDLANFFYDEGNYTKASSYFRKVTFPALTNSQQSEGHFKWGYSYFNQKKLDEALEQFNFVKGQNNAFSPAASYYAGFIESSKGMYDEALTDLKKAESSPSYANIVPYLITNIYFRQKQYDRVIEYGDALRSRRDVANASDISALMAESYYYKADYKNATEAYQRYFDKNARAENGMMFRAGYANYTIGNTEQGIQYLDKAAAGKDTVSYYASYYLGILYLKQGNKPLALNAFDYARKNPADAKLAEESAFQLGKVSYDAGKPDQAIAEFEKFIALYPRSIHTNEVKELLAQAYVNGNNYNKAIEYIESLPARNPFINQAYQKATYLKGGELFNKEEYASAVENFEKSLRYPVDPGYVTLASFWNAEAYSIGRRYESAIPHYQKVISMAPNVDNELFLKSRYGLGYAHYNLKAWDKAQFNFKDFTNRTDISNPNYTDGLLRLADCYYVARQYSDALATYNKAKTASTADGDYILLQTGVISGVMKKYAEARKHLSELITRYPRSQYRDEAIYKRAEFDIEQSDYNAAMEGLTQLIREGRNSRFIPYAHVRRAASAFNLKQYDRSISDYAIIVDRYPKHPVAKEALPLLQEVLNLAGRSDEFSAYLQKIQRANPEDPNYENLEYEAAKNIYFSQQYDKAITSLKAYLQNYPGSVNQQEAKYYLAESHYRLNQFDQAIPVYTELSNDPGLPQASRVVSRLAEIHFRLKQYEQAARSYKRLERVAATKREQAVAWMGLMESYYILGKYDSTEAYARIIIDRGGVAAGAQNKASLYLGKAALSKGDLEGAKDEFLNTLNSARDENGAEAKYLLATIFYNQKEYKQAYETLVSLNNDFSAYDEWVGRSFLLLADNFIATNDVFQARHTLQSLIDNFPLAHIKEEARVKLRKLEADELDKRKKIEADTLDN
jgi:TolA-binding protein